MYKKIVEVVYVHCIFLFVEIRAQSEDILSPGSPTLGYVDDAEPTKERGIGLTHESTVHRHYVNPILFAWQEFDVITLISI